MIHPQALVDDREAVGCETNVWAFAHIMSGARVGNHCNIGDHAFVESGAVVGNNVTIKNQVLIWEGITIEDDVFVGPGVIFTNDRYPRSPRMANARQRYADKAAWLQPTRVRRGASLGAAATICPGLELGHYCMVAAGAVVTQNVAAFSLVMGSPARQVHYVCSCGQKLAGHYLQSDCLHCGETATSRSLLLSSTAASIPS
ncbi:N-acetyltransferase [Roseimaritima ulvae]|uniref:dTDP-3-amino-3,6-dideoxy-alpha-D-galactopyranose 3-N-acetyltransferase n=1 Tax=Roseimaritima ulvae TaxID=980254 RepID=A0A5B9QJA9_9BACT|nr:acyltransferase [Roseimaritima ulvae]QEG38984.1 dTDP-3-amino-3,6-dideoxy-alpha-D-galactopyranose 3-N-acetyltransferase [Roseimaritima ulvae]